MEKTIVIHGLGYVGLTAAIHYAEAGWRVIGYDPDARTVLGINAGTPRAQDFLEYLQTDVKRLVDSGMLHATSVLNSEVLSCPVHSVAVPTEKVGEPFDDIIITAVTTLVQAVNAPKPLIIIESTLSPGTVDRILAAGGKMAGLDFNLAVCPRRDWFADRKKNLATLPRVVGGVTEECTQRAMRLLEQVTSRDLLLPTTYSVAELCKALENALLHVQVMFAQEVSVLLHDKNVSEALRLAGTHWRLSQLHLGIGTGGRCVPLGTKYLVNAMKQNGYDSPIGGAAIRLDKNMRVVIAEQVARHLEGYEEKSLILGIGYRPDFKDAGLSPGLAVVKHLRTSRIQVSLCDPLWTPGELEVLSPDTPIAFQPNAMFKVVILATAHTAFLNFPLDPSLWGRGQYVLDCTGAWSKHRELFKVYGVDYHVIGEPDWLT